MTAEDLWRLPNDHMRHELVRGELITMAPAGAERGMIGMRIGRVLGQFVDEAKLGFVFNADTGFFLSRNPDSVRAPDTAFVVAGRVGPSGLPQKYFDGPPDLAVEVLSPSDTVQEVDEKIAEYLDSGCRLAWVVSPRRKTVTVHRPNEQPLVLRETDTVTGGEVLPGFSCLVRTFFG